MSQNRSSSFLSLSVVLPPCLSLSLSLSHALPSPLLILSRSPLSLSHSLSLCISVFSPLPVTMQTFASVYANLISLSLASKSLIVSVFPLTENTSLIYISQYIYLSQSHLFLPINLCTSISLISPFLCLSQQHHIRQSVCMFACLSVCLSVYLFDCQSVCLSVCLSSLGSITFHNFLLNKDEYQNK